MNENYRPIFPSEKKLWKLRHESRGYEYKLIPLEQLEARPQPQVEARSLGALLLLGFLNLILSLSDPEDFGIEGGGKIETPQSTIGKIVML